GEALKSWYDGMFDQAVEESLDEVEEYGEGKASELEDDLQEAMDDAQASILNTRDSETESSMSEIERAKQAHLKSLIEEKGELLGYMEQEVFDVYMDNWLEIQALAAEGAAHAEEELTDHTGEKGEEALQHVTDELTLASDNAVQDLEDAIEQAKQEIEAELDTNQESFTDNVKKEIGLSVEAPQETITSVKEDLVEEQQEIIVAHAAELEEDAKNSLDEVVNGINE